MKKILTILSLLALMLSCSRAGESPELKVYKTVHYSVKASGASPKASLDESRYIFESGDRLFITFSSAAVDTSYVVGLLQIEKGRDLLDRKNWKKTGYPLLTSRSMPGEFGTGHNAYVIDPDGEISSEPGESPGEEELS